MCEDSDDTVRVWLVERTYSDDEQNLIILTYATTDGEQYFRKERALTSFTDVRDTTAAVDADRTILARFTTSTCRSSTPPRPSECRRYTTP